MKLCLKALHILSRLAHLVRKRLVDFKDGEIVLVEELAHAFTAMNLVPCLPNSGRGLFLPSRDKDHESFEVPRGGLGFRV